MPTDSAVALSAAVIGIALAGALAGLRSGESRAVRLSLAAVFALCACIGAIPLVIALFRPAYTLYMPAVLPILLALPVAIHRQAEARIGAPYSRSAKRRDAILPGLGLVVMAGYWMLTPGQREALVIEGRLPDGPAPAALASATFALVPAWIAVSSAYLVATLRALRRHRTALKAIYSNTEGLELRWLDAFLLLLIGLWAVSALAIASENLRLGAVISGELIPALTAVVLLVLIAMSLRPAPARAAGAAALTSAAPPSIP